jgi:hypothetical protein
MHLTCQLMYGMFAAILNRLFSICGMLEYLEHRYTAVRSHELEFIQAVQEVVHSLKPVLSRMPQNDPLLCFASKRVPFT